MEVAKFDTCPSTLSVLSLINLQVAVGGQNVLNSTLNMTYENFWQQVNLAEQLTSSDFGVSTGLISQRYWEASKWYFVNNSNVAIDVLIFTFYSDQSVIVVLMTTITNWSE